MKLSKVIFFTAIAVIIVIGGTIGFIAASNADKIEKVEVKEGVQVERNTKAEVDISNVEEGFIIVKYIGGKDVRIRAQVGKTNGTTYNYDINNKGNGEIIPLTEGDGTYTVTIYENTSGTKYAKAFACKVTVKLRNEYSPFLYPNQFVNFNEDSEVVKKAEELVNEKDTDLEKLTKIYNFVVDNFKYDKELAATVKSGYLPDLDKVLESKTGICFDYSAVMAAMLRSQNIPCKMIFGYAGTTYHAWINVYIDGEGWIDSVIHFDGEKWTLMDPTYASTGKRSTSAMKYITNPKNYSQKYAY